MDQITSASLSPLISIALAVGVLLLGRSSSVLSVEHNTRHCLAYLDKSFWVVRTGSRLQYCILVISFTGLPFCRQQDLSLSSRRWERYDKVSASPSKLSKAIYGLTQRNETICPVIPWSTLQNFSPRTQTSDSLYSLQCLFHGARCLLSIIMIFCSGGYQCWIMRRKNNFYWHFLTTKVHKAMRT